MARDQRARWYEPPPPTFGDFRDRCALAALRANAVSSRSHALAHEHHRAGRSRPIDSIVMSSRCDPKRHEAHVSGHRSRPRSSRRGARVARRAGAVPLSRDQHNPELRGRARGAGRHEEAAAAFPPGARCRNGQRPFNLALGLEQIGSSRIRKKRTALIREREDPARAAAALMRKNSSRCCRCGRRRPSTCRRKTSWSSGRPLTLGDDRAAIRRCAARR